MNITRRDFLKKTGVGIAGLSLSGSLAQSLLAGETAASGEWLPGKPTGHTITAIDLFRFNSPRPLPWKKDNVSKWTVFRLTTDKGAQGWALMEGHRKPVKARLIHQIKRALIGQDPGSPEGLLERMVKQRIGSWEYCFYDTAVWDLLGRIYNKPIHAMLTGGTKRKKIGCYFSAGCSLGNETWLKTLETCMNKGCPGYKIHPWVYIKEGLLPDGRNKGHKDPNKHPSADIEIYGLLRKQAGPDYPLMTDNFHTYTFDEAVEVGKALDDLKYFWYESPMPEEDSWIDKHIRLREIVKTPICAPEHGKTPRGKTPWSRRIGWNEKEAVDINRMDFWMGGITGLYHLAQDCSKRDMRIEIHNYATWQGTFYPQHIWAAYPENIGGWCELFSYPVEPAVPPGFKNTPFLVFENGYITVPSGPGAGVDLDWDYLKKNNIAEEQIK